MDSLYHDKLLAEYHAPKNYGLRDGLDMETRGSNPLCGDSITVRLSAKKGIINDVCFESEGCVISKAAASLTSEYIKNRPRQAVRSLTHADIIDILGIAIMPARTKCATLFLDTVKRVI